ncbi:nitrilase and fragile histidine triad fusion protein NitFhit isoform X2 [Eurytemora carolleeae]|uniref:nitrilase and fragile histidine triad fusion protein NitFhit isoform X2 n=1 Tax=Eurytemora carolleeae TaxID=1294199 RepID=UPI000C757407|nr:nitrilase and fragile histidine triad fusion protein NitFhit isoform X2 [Eurytemora carolleeae]|eukprot:XP_023345807.1 nitrilase and fragile histidine triad fusion protein NitFhit-like isoform X2 [Eurytemora affinis]
MNRVPGILNRTIKNHSRGMSWVAVCQMTSTNDLQANYEQASGLVEKAAARGVKMVFLPEAFDFIGESGAESLKLAQSLTGDTLRQFQDLAEKNKVWISLGGFHQKDGDKMLNTHILVDSEGGLVETYDKAHLFDVEIPGKIRLKESDYVNPGKLAPKPVPTPIGSLGLGICYDIRFPELSSGLRAQGAEILTYPSAFTVPTGMAHWKPLLQARAIENQCYVIAAAQTGQHNVKRSSYGHAMILDPWGTVLAECRTNMPVNQHRRSDLFQPPLPVNSELGLPENDWVFKFGPAKVLGHSIFHRTSLSVVFVNKKPVLPGHVLVSPLRNVGRLVDLLPNELTDLFTCVQKVEKFLMHHYSTDSCTVSIQDGPGAGQTIPHLHVHVLPRRSGDFQENDDIYRELENHDKVVTGWREENEMAAESEIFRYVWKHLFC